jgi:NMD protein affecting ribosome stability and mRNA decay
MFKIKRFIITTRIPKIRKDIIVTIAQKSNCSKHQRTGSKTPV